MNYKTSFILGATLALNMTIASADDAAAIKLEKSLCVVCHGVGGNSTSPLFPRLVGQRAAYMEEQLKAFKNKTRADKDAQDYMWGWAGLLTDDEIKTLAAYYEKQKPSPGLPTDSAMRAKGEDIFKNGVSSKGIPACFACHGANAEGNPQMVPVTPRLAGQNASYLIKQLKVFKGEQRPAAIAMHEIVKTLSDEEIEAVANYLQSK